MKRHIVLILILTCFKNNTAKSQTDILVPLKTYHGYNFRTGYYSAGKLAESSSCKISGKEKFTQYKVWAFPLWKGANKFSLYEKIDNILIPFSHTQLNVLAGLDTSQQLHLIADLNFDNNFDSDTALIYKPQSFASLEQLETALLNLPFSKIETFTKTGIKSTTFFQLQPLAFYGKTITGVNSKKEDILNIIVRNTQYFSGEFSIGKKYYNIKSFTNISAIKYKDEPDFFQTYISDDKYKNVDSQYASLAPLRIGDTIELQKKLYFINYDLNDVAFKLTYAGKPSLNGVVVGRRAKEIEGLSKDSNLVSLKSQIGNYILLDFGFVGCGYCIEALPKLNKLSNQYQKDNLKIFSIIGTNSKKSFINYLKNYDILNSISIYDTNWKTKTGISSEYKIGYFPTYILVNKKGIICMREYGLDGLTKIEKYLAEVFDK